MFRAVLPPIIRSAYNCIYSIWYLSHRYCYLPLSWKRWNRFECAVGGVRHPQHTQTVVEKVCGAHYTLGPGYLSKNTVISSSNLCLDLQTISSFHVSRLPFYLFFYFASSLLILTALIIYRDNTVRLDDPGFEPLGGIIFPIRPDRPRGPRILLYDGYRALFPEIKQPGRGVNHPLPSSSEVRERGVYTSTSPRGLYGLLYNEFYLYLNMCNE
jgi:hypothetical protein